ncbi:hypothetical protein EYF80_009070 [Liparis tanakae]|uniref:Uncharacterized protein n=1 Tax=Liparis tanakae TaxID=230148 RepID=A0A4Z2ISZ5_9TELE|nr:hypothetical protein EYF80_009070 [Liparis tanakae]
MERLQSIRIASKHHPQSKKHLEGVYRASIECLHTIYRLPTECPQSVHRAQRIYKVSSDRPQRIHRGFFKMRSAGCSSPPFRRLNENRCAAALRDPPCSALRGLTVCPAQSWCWYSDCVVLALSGDRREMQRFSPGCTRHRVHLPKCQPPPEVGHKNLLLMQICSFVPLIENEYSNMFHR